MDDLKGVFMRSSEDRLRAVRHYLKLGMRVGLTIRQPGFRRMHAMLTWQSVSIPEKVVRRRMKQERLVAVAR